ncbi:MAG TPA: hypothetical protein DCP92_06975 [Nitrospiraceae bacterium]|nr:hypothetical protein [Nitrospiraceae bacterium]
MTYKCPKCGADSSDKDYCSDCGALIGATTLKNDASVMQPASPADVSVAGETCPDCLTPRVSGSRFCEVCRYDFQTKSSGTGGATPDAPDTPLTDKPAQSFTTAPQSASDHTTEFVPPPISIKLNVAVTVDPSLVTEPEVLATCPKDTPERVFPLDLDENLVGRRSDKKGIYPEIEINDPGISHRHLKFIKQQEGFTVLDLGSANGTLLNGSPLLSGVSTPVKAGDEFVIGMWTCLKLRLRN